MSEHIVISLEPCFADLILSGEKKVELRRRRMRVAPETMIWLYAKVPVGAVVGCVLVKSLHAQTPQVIWRRFGSVSGLTRPEFFQYFEGAETAFALELQATIRLSNPVLLEELRRIRRNFQPPQFFTRISAQSAERAILETRRRESGRRAA